MRLIKDQPLILIKPNFDLAQKILDEIIKTGGSGAIPDEIVKAMSGGSLRPGLEFEFRGIYPNQFQDHEEAGRFKDELDILVNEKNLSSGKLKINCVDDVLFIIYTFYSNRRIITTQDENGKYLEDLIDTYIKLVERKTSSTGDTIWIADGVDSRVIPVERTNFSISENERLELTQRELIERQKTLEESLILNDGYHSYPIMIGEKNILHHVPNDSLLKIAGRNNKEKDILLPAKISKMLTNYLIKHIVDEHTKANSAFYKDLSTGNDKEFICNKFRNRERVRLHKHSGLLLKLLTDRLKKYFNDSCCLTPSDQELYVFIFDLFQSLKLDDSKVRAKGDKASHIRLLIRRNTN